MTLSSLRIPLDLSTFGNLRRNGYLYVDKTQHAYNLVTGGGRFFISRPRRFGRSLFVSMLQEILLANRSLFDGLWIANSDYHWRPHGVIKLDLSSIGARSASELEHGIRRLLAENARFNKLDVALPGINSVSDLCYLVAALYARFGRVAILIDEYNSPVLGQVDNRETMEAMCDVLHPFFAAIKELDEFINFVFIAGVSSFAKPEIFSEMNDLQVISIDEDFSAIFGYTDREIDTYFSGHIQAWADRDGIGYAEQKDKLCSWYGGHKFLAAGSVVYSSFSIMKALSAQKLENFWFSSATPTFLVRKLKQQKADQFESFKALLQNESIIVARDSLNEVSSLTSLLFQTGYLTITHYNNATDTVRLGCPNFEVEQSLKSYLLRVVTTPERNFTVSAM